MYWLRVLYRFVKVSRWAVKGRIYGPRVQESDVWVWASDFGFQTCGALTPRFKGLGIREMDSTKGQQGFGVNHDRDFRERY